MAITRRLYKGLVTTPDQPARTDLVSPRIRIRVTKVTNRGWPYPPKVGDVLTVRRYARS